MDLDRLTLTAIAETGDARRRQEEKARLAEEKRLDDHRRAISAELLEIAKNQLPAALHPHASIHSIYESAINNKLGVSVAITVPEWAVIMLHFDVEFKANRYFVRSLSSIERTGQVNLVPCRESEKRHITVHAYSFGEEDEIVIGRDSYTGNPTDIFTACAYARQLTDNRNHLIEQFQAKAEALATIIAAPAQPETDRFSGLMTISGLNLMYSEANSVERYLEVIAGALLQIADKLDTVSKNL